MSKLPPKLPLFVPDDRYSIEQYLAIERSTGKRYEYHDGQLLSVESMAGGSPTHSLLSGHVIRVTGNAIIERERDPGHRRGCDAHTSDLRIAVDGGKRYLYADAVIVCGEPTFDSSIPSAVTNPITVFEVTSPSSVTYDRSIKFEFYGKLDSVREYVIVEQDQRLVEVRHRASAGAEWTYTVIASEGGDVPIPSLGLKLPLASLYRNWTPDR